MADTKAKKDNKKIAVGQSIKIDAQGQSVGRLAAEIASYLQDKHSPGYAPNKAGETMVEVENIKEIVFTGKKWSDKKYYRHSGYLGNLREQPAEKIFKEKPEEILKMAVWGMLPKNRLRKPRIKRLKFV
jgi:large subunit ribosomal protein L13